MKKTNVLARRVAAFSILPAVLAACGGGDSPAEQTPVTPASLSISGTAATGAAIAGGAVDVKCAAGAGSATTSADGSYTVTVSDGSLPCVLKVTPTSGVALYSVATGTGSSATANISPVTQLVIASLTGTDPEAYFTGFDSTAAAAVTSENLATAVSAVKTTLLAAGVDLGTIDVLAGTLTPATGTTAGNAYDQALDALAAKLAAAGTTLTTLATTVAAASTTTPSSGTPATSGTPSLPAELLLKPAAASCAALRSGTYRVVNPTRGAPLAELTGKIVVDAATLAVTFTDGSAGSWVPHATEACRFVDADDGAEVVVSPAGVLVARSPNGDGTHSLAIGIPEQAHAVTALAGDWNLMALAGTDAGAFAAAAGTGTLNASGAFTAATWCQNATTWGLSDADCAAEATDALDTFSLNTDGGFDSRSPGESAASGRAFMYKAGGGEVMVVAIYDDGSIALLTKQRTETLPPVGRVSKSWSLTLNSQLLAPAAVSTSSNTIVSVDSVAGSWVRTQHSASGPEFDYPETLLGNTPRAGYTHRPAATSTAANGSSVNVREFNVLSLRGMGLNPVVIPSTKSFILSVNRP